MNFSILIGNGGKGGETLAENGQPGGVSALIYNGNQYIASGGIGGGFGDNDVIGNGGGSDQTLFGGGGGAGSNTLPGGDGGKGVLGSGIKKTNTRAGSGASSSVSTEGLGGLFDGLGASGGGGGGNYAGDGGSFINSTGLGFNATHYSAGGGGSIAGNGGDGYKGVCVVMYDYMANVPVFQTFLFDLLKKYYPC